VSSRPLHAVVLTPDLAAGRFPEMLAAALAGTGPALAPVDPGLPRAKLAEVIGTLAPSAVLTEQEVVRGARAGSPPDAAPGVPDDVALVVTTSGSTGRPKAVQLSAAALRASAEASLRRLGAPPGARWLACLPAYHIAGLQVLVRSLLAGSSPVFRARLDPAELPAGCDYVSLVPAQLRRLTEARAELAAFRAILLGGAAAPPRLLADARGLGARVVTSYGMTETCGGCVYDGVPLDGVRVRIGGGGRIAIAGPVLFSGYRLRPDLTRAVLAGGEFRTADLGELDGAGLLRILGRADDIINTGGAKVAAAEVEAVLSGCPGVAEVAVIGTPDQRWGEAVTAVVVPADPADPPSLQALRAHARAALPGYAAPRALRLVARIPLLRSGKPDRRALREARRLISGLPRRRTARTGRVGNSALAGIAPHPPPGTVHAEMGARH
jgi:O-succinylbenzoic acid--CoA ligase